jgi:hypothetical protein
MKMKKTLLVFLILGVTVSLFGYGQMDEYRKRSEDLNNLIESKEKVSLTGEVIVSNRVFPEFKTGTTVYKLIVPRYCLTDPDITDNKVVTVEGVILKVKQGVNTRLLKEGEEVLLITRAVIDGKEYNPEQGYGEYRGPCQDDDGNRQGWMGPHHRRGNLRGPGFQGPFMDIFE